MRWIVFLCLLFPSIGLTQQRLYLTLFGGVSNYQGDLRDKRFAWDQSRGAFGLGLNYELGRNFALRTGVNFAKISGDDKKNIPELRYRNLNFQSNIVELNAVLEYSFSNLDQKRYSPYVFAGLGVFHFDPYTYDTLGNKFYLQPLGTEGQGLSRYPDRKMYNRTQLSIPFGGGIKFSVNERIVLAWEIGLRKLFTDYLDDVSITYVDQSTLAQVRGAKAVELAYRAGELKDGNQVYPGDGSMRGKGNLKDWYYFQGISLAIDIFSNNGSGLIPRSNTGKYKLACPKVW